MVIKTSGMGDSLSSMLNILCHAPGSTVYCIGLVFYEFQRELQLMERDRALMELERRWREGEQWPQTSKTARLLLNFIRSID